MRKIIHIEVGSELDELLKKQAGREYITISSLVRRIIREYVTDPRNETVFSRHQKAVSITKQEIL